MRRFVELALRGLAEPTLYILLLEVLLSWLVPFGLQWLLVRRMSAERRERAWNALTWCAAIVWFSPNAAGMIPFAWVTRPKRGAVPGLLALLWGSALALGVLIAQALLLGALEWALLGKPLFE